MNSPNYMNYAVVKCTPLNELKNKDMKMLSKAVEAAEKSVENFRVGACLVSKGKCLLCR